MRLLRYSLNKALFLLERCVPISSVTLKYHFDVYRFAKSRPILTIADVLNVGGSLLWKLW